MGVLRLLLAIAVIASHTDYFLPFITGSEAVRIFFAISGFYMALILDKKYASIWLFYSNRFLRLYPAYVLILAASVAWYLVILAYTRQRPPPFWIAQANSEMAWWQWASLQLSSVTMIGLDLPSLFHWKSGEGFQFMHYVEERAPDGAEWGGWLPWIRQAWSVGAEIWFYFLAPFVLRGRLLFQLMLAFSSLTLWLFLLDDWPLLYYFFPANLWIFMGGALLYKFYSSRFFLTSDIISAAVFLIAIVATCTLGTVKQPELHQFGLMIIGASIPFVFDLFKRQRWDAFIGNLSYPVYIVHLLVVSVLQILFHSSSGLAATMFSLLVAVLIFFYVEKPVDRWRQSRVKRAAEIENRILGGA